MQPARWLGGITFAWGLVATFSAFCNTKGAFIACRLLLGVFEAGLFPGMRTEMILPTKLTNICLGFLVYLSMFYNKRSIALRVAYLFSTAAWAGALGGLVAYAIGFLDAFQSPAGLSNSARNSLLDRVKQMLTRVSASTKLSVRKENGDLPGCPAC